MIVLRNQTAPRYERAEGITSYLLASPRTAGAKHLTSTCVVLEAGGRQRLHSHAPEQIYFILEGHGQMTVGEETSAVEAGDCVFIPSGVAHGLENNSEQLLRYFSAAAPAFDMPELESLWPLPSEVKELP